MPTNGGKISRRDFIKGTIAVTACASMSNLPALGDAERRPPNFIVILADDLGYNDLSCYGAPLIHTPRLDQMAAEGMKFTDFHTSAAVCTPTRASLMTGCYPLRVGLPAVLNYKSKIGINSEELTIAELLKSRGYATMCIGKWHLGWQKPFLPTRHGFDSYYGLPYSNDMGVEGFPVPLIRDEKIIEQPVNQETLTERYTEEAIKFITENKNRPFFLYLPHTFPHVPLHASERFRGKSKGGLYGDVVETIDWSTGEILDTLKKLNLDNITLVIFTSDNGPWLQKREQGGSAFPLRNGKGSTWEGGFRVPCIMRWPGHIPAGKICDQLATVMDFLPTFAHLAGTAVPRNRMIDGKNIWPLMSGQPGAISPYDVFFMYRVERLEAVRMGKWKLALPREEVGTKEQIPLSLYNLEDDIGETTDVSSRYPRIVKRLLAEAERCREDLGDVLTGAPGKNRRPPGRVA